jgi:hypothetical protein
MFDQRLCDFLATIDIGPKSSDQFAHIQDMVVVAMGEKDRIASLDLIGADRRIGTIVQVWIDNDLPLVV